MTGVPIRDSQRKHPGRLRVDGQRLERGGHLDPPEAEEEGRTRPQSFHTHVALRQLDLGLLASRTVRE